MKTFTHIFHPPALLRRGKRAAVLLCMCAAFAAQKIPAQEALKSTEEEYYDFLSLNGMTDRPYLNYRTLSDSMWQINPEAEGSHVWKNNNLGKVRPVAGQFSYKIYGPELFMSVNTAAPYGQNDGALWQGRGFNASLTGGARIEAYGLEITLKPQLSFSQNAGFAIMPSAYDSEYGYFWGYAHNQGADAPQRFGNKPFFTFDWGDTEIRYTWENLTIGFGTQAVWLGPAYLNPILHSNNAPSYPKLDFGLRRQRIAIPKLGWYLGDVEFRMWTGYLSESDYFDSSPDNNHNMIHGLSFAYAPSFLQGFTIGVNRICLVKWDWKNLKYIIPIDNNTTEDQKLSVFIDWVFEKAGLEIYGELGVDDFIPRGFPVGYIRYPFHTLAYTVGLKKSFTLSSPKEVYGALHFEWYASEMSQDFQMQWPYNFGFHHQITQGYTNRGQWLGAGSGYGGNCQYLDFTIYYSRGNTKIILSRSNPDNNYIYSKSINDSAQGGELGKKYFTSWKANFNIGVSTVFFATASLNINGYFIYNLIINPQYQNSSKLLQNPVIGCGIKYQF